MEVEARRGEDLSMEEVAIFKADFDLLDANQAGSLDREDIKVMLRIEMGKEPTEAILDDFWACAAMNKDGRVGFDEYLNVILGRGWTVGGQAGVPWPTYMLHAEEAAPLEVVIVLSQADQRLTQMEEDYTTAIGYRVVRGDEAGNPLPGEENLMCQVHRKPARSVSHPAILTLSPTAAGCSYIVELEAELVEGHDPWATTAGTKFFLRVYCRDPGRVMLTDLSCGSGPAAAGVWVDEESDGYGE